MVRKLLLTFCFLYFSPLYAEDYYSDYANDYARKNPSAGYAKPPSQQAPADKRDPTYQGYPGDTVFDKFGRPVIFEGPGVSRKDAENYVERYNKTH